MPNTKDYLELLKSLKDKRMIKFLTGPRFSGKTRVLKEFMYYLLEQDVSQEQILYIDTQNPRNQEVLTGIKLFNYINSKTQDHSKKYYIFIDEIQNILNFKNIIAILIMKQNLDVYVTSSNFNTIANVFTKEFLGRFVKIDIYPNSYPKYLDGRNSKNFLNKYLLNGTFETKSEILGAFNTILIKDVFEQSGINNVFLLEKLIKFLYENLGVTITPNKINEALTNAGYKNSINTTNSYLDSLLNSYMFYKIKRLNLNNDKVIQTGEKYFTSYYEFKELNIGVDEKTDSTYLNAIFLELKRREYNIFAGKLGDSEIDFVVKNTTNKIYINFITSKSRDNEYFEKLVNLQLIQDELGKKVLITLDDGEENIKGIKRINFIEFLLGKEI